ncbi:MAG: accessory factor UbiK family protein [Gammaproteobacteria bacterium]|nr:accessory factor UbiK family protein [Gammaproteobacteria bacterium]
MNKLDFEDIASKITQILPPAPGAIKTEIEDNIRRIMQKSFEKFDLVTREEFDIQQAVLQRTRIKLEALEARIDELENK